MWTCRECPQGCAECARRLRRLHQPDFRLLCATNGINCACRRLTPSPIFAWRPHWPPRPRAGGRRRRPHARAARACSAGVGRGTATHITRESKGPKFITRTAFLHMCETVAHTYGVHLPAWARSYRSHMVVGTHTYRHVSFWNGPQYSTWPCSPAYAFLSVPFLSAPFILYASDSRAR